MVTRLFAVTIDCPDPHSLARFYRAFLGGDMFSSNDDFVALDIDGNVRLDFQRVTNPTPAPWPDPSGARRLHLDFEVDDLDRAEEHLQGIGAVRADFQPDGRRYRVLFDPAGHPFCIATKSAAATNPQSATHTLKSQTELTQAVSKAEKGPGRTPSTPMHTCSEHRDNQ
ncbi:VOC family protein [Actinomadura welshii]